MLCDMKVCAGGCGRWLSGRYRLGEGRIAMLAATVRELNAWNAGVILAFLACICWWRSDGKVWVRDLMRRCRGCGRDKQNCSCVDIVFTPWEGDDE